MSEEVEILGEASGTTVQAFIDLTLLNCDLIGVYQYQVIPGPPEEKKTKILVMPTDPEPKEMKLLELITEINNIIKSFGGGAEVSQEEMKQTLASMGLTVLENISVEIRQLFLFLDRSSIEKNSKPCEYAFNFVITNDVKPEDSLKIFKIKQLGFAVYNTKRTKIIERMKLQDINKLLADS